MRYGLSGGAADAFDVRKPVSPRVPPALCPVEIPYALACWEDSGSLERVRFDGAESEHASYGECELSESEISHVRFSCCNFENASFSDVRFSSCDFSNSMFDQARFLRCTFLSCKFTGCSFLDASFEDVVARDSTFAYAGMNRARFYAFAACAVDFSSADLSEMSLHHVAFDDVRFLNASFFCTPLAGVDLTSCQLGGVVLSDNMRELRGVRMDLLQAASLARRIGVVIAE